MTQDDTTNEVWDGLEACFAGRDAFVRATREVMETDCIPREEWFTDLLAGLSREAQVALAFQLLGQYIDPEADGITREGKHFAVDLGYEAGPDFAQGFYKLGCAISNADR